MSATPRPGTARVGGLRLQVSGLRELRAALRDLDAGLPAELRGTNKRVVDELLVPAARGRAQGARGLVGATGAYNAESRRSRYHWADVVNSIRGVASQTSAAILMGSTARTKGWMLGWEFGSMGNNNPPRNKSQFPPWRGAGTSAGYFFFPAIRSSGPRIVDAYAQALDRFLAAKMPRG